MFNLKNEKLEVFKKFVIGEDFKSVEYGWQDFTIESYCDNKLVLDINVTSAFGFLPTDEEFHYINNIISGNEVVNANIKSKLIDKISIEVDKTTLNVTFHVNVYSREVEYPRSRNYNEFIRENNFPSEQVKTIYDIENLSVTNDLLNVDGSTKSILKSVDNNLELNLFTQIDNLNPRIYLYMYLQTVSIMIKNNMIAMNVEDVLDNILITCNIDIKNMFAHVSNNKISAKELKELLIQNSRAKLMFIPLISLYDLNLLVCRRGYFFPENSLYLDEFTTILHLSESEILNHYNLLNCKGYRVLIRKNLENIYHIKKLEAKGFKYKDIINILNNLNIYNARTDIILDSPLLDIYLKNNSKKEVIKKMFTYKNCYNTIKDTIEMLDKIIKTPVDTLQKCNISSEPLSYDNLDNYFNCKLSINNLEREVINIYNLIDEIGFNLYYKEKDGASSEFFEYNLPNLDYNQSEYLVYQEGDYSLWLPLNSNILKKIGRELQICVGNYAHKIKNEESVVLFVKREDKCIGCIELDYTYETLKQAKIRQNKLFNEREQEFIYSFCKSNEISIDTHDVDAKYNMISA